MADPIAPGTLDGVRALVTGSSRGIGADTASYLAAAGAKVAVNYRNKARRAEQIVAKVVENGGAAIAVGADLTDHDSVVAMVTTINDTWGGLDLLVLNASGGMEAGMGDDYALRLNRDAQVDVLRTALPLMAPGSRVVFVTSHQAHFVETADTLPEYLPVAKSKRAGELALRALLPQLTAAGVEFVVVSGDMIEGTITATLLERINPGAISGRRESVGRLYNVSEFAAEVAAAAVEPIPVDHTRLVGDVSEFIGTTSES
ncbi:SDR family oxidoreductase [Curtobacterium ammoniigenes]|uniref:SDR family oxidoreductase n=1 Tax=Curtobacterium ammoniigenes TaxID=395387 RepID=UPI000832EBA6|nr:SDR family oxidoreductase [Curtobacterium ammoniigenes]